MQTPEGEFQKCKQAALDKITEIEHAYHYTRKVLQATIELAESYLKYGRASAAVLPPLNVKAQPDAIVDTPMFQRIEMTPHVTNSAVQNVWNVWSEAESVARRAIPEVFR